MTPLRISSCCVVAAFIALAAPSSPAQERTLGSVQPLGVRVHLRSATLAGDTVTLAYAVENVRAGGEDFSALLVATPAPVLRMPKPARLEWVTNPRYRKQPIAVWVLVEDRMLPPGETSPELTLVARGLPDLVRYWAVPDLDAHPPRYVDGDSDEDPYFLYADSGTTVGIVPVPPGATPASLAARLRGLLGRGCGSLGWISKPGICHSLDVKLAHAQAAIASGQPADARNDLTALANELEAQHGLEAGKAVSDSAYALLSVNVAYLRARL